MITKIPNLVHVEILARSASLKVSWAQNSFWAWIVTPYNFGLMAQSKSQLENIFLGPIFNFWFLMVQNNFGPVLDFGLNHIEAQLPVENPNN